MKTVEYTDKELVESYLNGNHTSFELLINRQQNQNFFLHYDARQGQAAGR